MNSSMALVLVLVSGAALSSPRTAFAQTSAPGKVVATQQGPGNFCDEVFQAAKATLDSVKSDVATLTDSASKLDAAKRVFSDSIASRSAILASHTSTTAADSTLRAQSSNRLIGLKDSLNQVTTMHEQIDLSLARDRGILAFPTSIAAVCQNDRQRDSASRAEIQKQERSRLLGELKGTVGGLAQTTSTASVDAGVTKAVLIFDRKTTNFFGSAVSGITGLVGVVAGVWPVSSTPSNTSVTIRRIATGAGASLVGISGYLFKRESETTQKYVGRLTRNAAYTDAVAVLDSLDSVMSDSVKSLAAQDTARIKSSADSLPSVHELATLSAIAKEEADMVDELKEVRSIALDLQMNHADEVVGQGTDTQAGHASGKTILGQVVNAANAAIAVWNSQIQDHADMIRRFQALH